MSCFLCVISPPEFDVSTAALYLAWIAGRPPEAMHALARDFYDRGSCPPHLLGELSALEEDEAGDGEAGEDEAAGDDDDADDAAADDDEGVGGEGDGKVKSSFEQGGGVGTPEKGRPDSPRGEAGGGEAGTTETTATATATATAPPAAAAAAAALPPPLPAATLVFRRKRNQQSDEISELIKSAVSDDIRTFEALEHYLQTPTLLRSQTMIQIRSVKMQAFVVEKYWSLDDVVVREVVVGSKRLTRSRKDLDDVSESTGKALRSVTRQFDNLKRLYTQVEDLEDCNLVEHMRTNVLLSPELSRKYACILFLLYSKFTLTSKRRIQRVKLRGLERCAASALACLVSDSATFFRGCKQGLVADITPTGAAGWAFRQAAAGAGAGAEAGLNGGGGGSPHLLGVGQPLSSQQLQQQQQRRQQHASSFSSPERQHSSSVSSAAGVPLSQSHSLPQLPQDGQQLPPPQSPAASPTGLTLSGGNAGAAITTAAAAAALAEVSDDQVCEALTSGDAANCWSLVWHVMSYVGAMDVDKQLMNNLRDIKTVVTGEVLNNGCVLVTNSLLERGGPGGAAVVRKLDGSGRMRNLLKTLMQIGANLSQSKEYRDFFEDVLTKVAEPLEEAGLGLADMKAFMTASAALVRAIPDSHRISTLSQQNSSSAQQGSSRKDTIDRRKDWARFVFCCRLVLVELVEAQS